MTPDAMTVDTTVRLVAVLWGVSVAMLAVAMVMAQFGLPRRETTRLRARPTVRPKERSLRLIYLNPNLGPTHSSGRRLPRHPLTATSPLAPASGCRPTHLRLVGS